MADGYARAKQHFGVCMGIGGPGITNMITAIASAYVDQSPVLVIGGCIPREWEGLEAVQDSSFSGISDVELMRPITNFSNQIPVVSAVPRFFKKAIRAMFGIKKGPAFISIPLYMQDQGLDAEAYEPLQLFQPQQFIDHRNIDTLFEILKNSHKIGLLIGNGCVQSKASEIIKHFIEQFSIPVVTTLRAKGAISEDHPLSFGVFGIGGTLQATQMVLGSDITPQAALIDNCEILIVLGASLNEQNAIAVGNLDTIKHIIHVDINPDHFEDVRYKAIPILADAATFITQINDDNRIREVLDQWKSKRIKWIDSIQKTARYDTEQDRHCDHYPMHPARILVELRKAVPADALVIVDSGAHTFFTAHHWTSYAPNQCFVWTNNGPMGYAVAGAIGAKIAHPDKICIAIIGDGGMMMHGIEIQTAARYNIPVIVLILNNAALANVFLRAHKEGQKESMALTTCPFHDWASFAISLGAEGVNLDHYEQLQKAFDTALNAKGPFVINARCGKEYQTPNPGESVLL